MAQDNTHLGSQYSWQSMADPFHATDSFPLLSEPCSIHNFTTHSVLGSPTPTFAEGLNTSAPDVSLTYSVSPRLQSQVYRQSSFDLADFSLMDLPAGNNISTLMLQDMRQILPFAQFEQSMLSRRIFLESSAGHNAFGGFAFRVVAGILSSENQSMVRQASDLKRSLRMLDAQIPGENSALITNDQAFETKFARVLLFSMLNGFAGLDDIPMENILRYLNQCVVNKLLLDILEKSPRYVSRTLADNIFRAAIEASDTKVVNLLLNRRLVDVNETVCLHKTRKYTPIERASSLGSLDLMRSLINAGADANKYYAIIEGNTTGGALSVLSCYRSRTQEGHETDKFEAVKMLVAAGARLHPDIVFQEYDPQIMEFYVLVSQNILPERHRDFFQYKQQEGRGSGPFEHIVQRCDDHLATRFVQNVISLCHQAGCNRCLADFDDVLENIAIHAALSGKLELVKLLFQEADVKSDLSHVFLGAIRSKSPDVIDFILSLGPNLDPPAVIPNPDYWSKRRTTPIAEAVRHGNEHLITILEAKGCLDHLKEGDRFQAVVAAAAETGNAAYMRKLLGRAGTSKQAYRVESDHVELALDGNHQDIALMLLDAGAFGWRISLPGTSVLEDMQILHALIAGGAYQYDKCKELAQKDRSIVAVLSNEFPGVLFLDVGIQQFLRKCIDTDVLDFFKAVLQILDLPSGSLDGCLLVAIELGHSNLVEYLLDMGANPFHDSVLEAAIPDKPDMLRLLLQKERRRQMMPKCIGARVLEPLMGNGAGNPEALDELIMTGAINFARLDAVYQGKVIPGLRTEYYHYVRLTPLGMAIQGVPNRFDSNIVTMRKLLDAGADPDEISKSHERWTKGHPLMTALMVAVETGLEDAVNMLLDYGADVDARPRIRITRTALQFAAELGNVDMVRLLMSRGADVNSPASSRGGATALQFAAMTGNCNMVAELLDHGAQLDGLPSRIDGMWPLEGAAANGRLDMVRFLWELNVSLVAGGTFPDGFSERHCLRAMNFARENGHIGCRDLLSDLSGISVDRLETDEYGAPWIAYCD